MRRSFLLPLWLASDIALFVLSYALAYALRVGWIFSSDFPFDAFLTSVVLVAPLWLIVLLQLGVFRLTRMQSERRNISYIIFANIVGLAMFSLGYYFLYTGFFSRLLLVYAFTLHSVGILLWHMLFERLMRRALRRQSKPAFPTLIVGATREAASLIRSMQSGRSPLMPVGVLDARGISADTVEGVPFLGKLNKLESTLQSLGITHLIQCSDLEQSINLLSACRRHGITYLLLPSVLGIVEQDERIEMLEGRPVSVVRPPEPWWKWFFS